MNKNSSKYEAFRFKQFTIQHKLCSMKVGIDGVLLGAWADCSDCKNILDVGTGSGLIALMLAQRNPAAQIHAVEIEHSAYLQTQINFNASPWASRLSAEECDFTKFSSAVKFDLIISNPPYFSNSYLSGNNARDIARHTLTLSINNLIEHAASLLSDRGEICLIYPFESTSELEFNVAKMNLSIKKLTLVKPNSRKYPKRILVEITKKTTLKCVNDELLIHLHNGEYASEFIELTKDFYIKF